MSGGTPWTPAPWRVVIDDDGNPLSGRPGIFASAELDCAIIHWDGFVQTYLRTARGDKEIHANARLIAAAPEMAEALQKIASRKWDTLTQGCDAAAEAADLARALLTKIGASQ